MSYIITIKQGNMLNEEDATFVVNASNTILKLGGGVSTTFKIYFGRNLQVEMDAKVQSIGEPLQKGDVVITSAINATNFKYILHVAIFDYNQGVDDLNKFPTLQTIADALINIEKYLYWYTQKYNTSKLKIVLPLLGTGIGKLDKNAVAKLYKEFFSEQVDFECEVVLYGFKKTNYETLYKIFNQE